MAQRINDFSTKLIIPRPQLSYRPQSSHGLSRPEAKDEVVGWKKLTPAIRNSISGWQFEDLVFKDLLSTD